jgi:hypothetical protein
MSIWSSLATWAKSGAPSSSSVLNTGLTMLTNYQNRQNALKDQQRLNLYNSPQQQMQRFKEAGLNPNLIYKQQNLGEPVRSTDFVAPKIDETQLDVLGKSTNITNRNLEQRSLMLRNDNQQLQNEILELQKNDLADKYFYQNEAAKAARDNAFEGVNLKRQERSQKDITNPLEVDRLKKQNQYIDEQIRALARNTDFQQLTSETQKKIAEQTYLNLVSTGESIKTNTGLNMFKQKMNDSLDKLNLGSGVAQDIIKILISKLLP